MFWKTFYCAGCDRLLYSGDRSIEDFCRRFRVGLPAIIFAQLVCCWRPHWVDHCTLWWDFCVTPTTMTTTRMDMMRSRCFRRVGQLQCRNRTDLWIGYDPVVHFRRTVFLFRRNLASRKGTVLYSFESGWRCRSWQGHHSEELRSTPIGNCLVEVELCWLSCWLLLFSFICCYQIKLSTYYSHFVSRALFVTALLLIVFFNYIASFDSHFVHVCDEIYTNLLRLWVPWKLFQHHTPVTCSQPLSLVFSYPSFCQLVCWQH